MDLYILALDGPMHALISAIGSLHSECGELVIELISCQHL